MAIEIKVNSDSTHLAFRNLLYLFRHKQIQEIAHDPLRYGSVFHNCRTAYTARVAFMKS